MPCMMLLRNSVAAFVWLLSCVPVAVSFGISSNMNPICIRFSRSLIQAQSSSDSSSDLENEASELLERARVIRASLPEEKKLPLSPQVTKMYSPWTVPESDDPGFGYRLYVDIGREQGTWMDPRWGASGKRIEFSMDIKLFSVSRVTQPVIDRMVKDNFGGTSSQVFKIDSSPFARLRSGFDRMACYGGGYRIDAGRNGAGTVRFHILVDGTPEHGSSNGDVYVPKGCLHFSLPCFGNSISQLSTKEGPVTVRQIGWHTGWRREESRIVGTFRAVPIEKARKRDGF